MARTRYGVHTWINCWMQLDQQPSSDGLVFSDQSQDMLIPEDDAGGSVPDPPVAQNPDVTLTPVRRYLDRIQRPPETHKGKCVIRFRV